MQKHLDDTVRRFLYSWLTVSAFLIFLIAYQLIFTNFFDQNTTAPWLWILLCIFPGLAVLFYSYSKFKDSEIRTVPRDSTLWRVLKFISAIYLVVVSLNLLSLPLNDSAKTYAEDLHGNDIGLLLLQFIFISLLLILLFRTNKATPAVPDLPPGDKRCVFISYNHKDEETALRLKELLEKNDISVIIDAETMIAGENIADFIIRAMRTSHATINVVSKNSLLSGWVGFETINSFFIERLFKNRLFIAGYLDEEFLDREFTLKSIKHLNTQLEEIRAITKAQQAEGSDTLELNEEISRIIDLKNNLSKIIERLRNSLCVDIRKEHLEKNFALILQSIKRK